MWSKWVKKLQSISQNGLEFNTNPYDVDRYVAIREIAAEITELNTDIEKHYILEIFKTQKGYSTPKVDVRALILKEGKILLVKEKADGKWSLPGGWADVNESPSESVEREVFEESGYIAKTKKLLAVYDLSKHFKNYPFPFHVYKMYFLCELTGGEAKTSRETDEIAFFDINNLPELSIYRIKKEHLIKFFEQAKNSNSPTEFD